MRRFYSAAIVLILPVFLLLSKPAEAANVFNALALKKMEVEQKYGITNLECFPFLIKIGSNADQAERVRHCQVGATTLASALKEVPKTGLRTVGISTRFLRSGGFHTLLVKWDATKEAMILALQSTPAAEEQKQFIAKVHQLKKQIQSGLHIRELYCTFKISNEQCLQGYQTLAEVEPDRRMSRMSWAVIAVTDTHLPEKDRSVLTLKFDDAPETMTQRMKQDPAAEEWKRQKKIYAEIKKLYGAGFKVLQLPNFFCDKSLVQEGCLEGAKNFHEATKDPGLRKKLWGTVTVHKYNTLIKSDHNDLFRYDLTPEEISRVFSKKPDQSQMQISVTLAEKLEKRTKNNATGLRAVCDLQGLQSAYCAQGFKTFIAFVRNNREYRVGRPFTNVMFIDGTQLSRVNFALNSKVRDSYIYIDVHSSPQEMKQHLFRFGFSKTDPK
jgi:regulator of replication initiation timing